MMLMMLDVIKTKKLAEMLSNVPLSSKFNCFRSQARVRMAGLGRMMCSTCWPEYYVLEEKQDELSDFLNLLKLN